MLEVTSQRLSSSYQSVKRASFGRGKVIVHLLLHIPLFSNCMAVDVSASWMRSDYRDYAPII